MTKFSGQTTQQNISPAITGGTPTAPGDYPWVVSITSNVDGFHCLGTIVNSEHVLTAAQCVLTESNTLVNPFFLTVTAGDVNLNEPTFRRVIRNVTHIYPHHLFNPTTRANNIAVIRVGGGFPFPHNTVEAIARINRPVLIGENCQFAGWGRPNAVCFITR